MPKRSAPPLQWSFDKDRVSGPVVCLKIDSAGQESEVPVHQHPEGQLIVALKGAVTCEVTDALWVVPPRCGVWVPGQIAHSIRATANAEMLHLFVVPGAAKLPQACCTLSLSALILELMLDLAERPSNYQAGSTIARKAQVLLDDLVEMPLEKLSLPVSQDPRIQLLARELNAAPWDRRTLSQWGSALAMSERSLARLVLQETGLTFGRWRQQLHLIIAMRQLAAGDSVQKTANDLGYESVNAFISMFKKLVGEPPARYFAARSAGGRE